MRRNIIFSLSFAAGTFASLNHQPAIYARSLGLGKRLTCPSIDSSIGACHEAATECPWAFPGEVADWTLCYQDTPAEGGLFWCYNPAIGQTCCANNNIANHGESCDGPTQASGTWLPTSTSGEYGASSMGPAPTNDAYSSSNSYGNDYSSSSSYGGGAAFASSSSAPWDSRYSSSDDNYRGTQTPGWPGASRTRIAGSVASSSVVAIGAGATAAPPRFALDAAGFALAAVWAMMV